MIVPTFDKEKNFVASGYKHIVGIDEVGRGPLVGPVVAAAVCWRGKKYPAESEMESFRLLRDSKTLSERQRQQAVQIVKKHFFVGIGMCDNRTIDRINILEASFLAMKKAHTDLLRRMRQENHFPTEDTKIVLIDGRSEIPNVSFKQKTIVGGDATVKSIAAASIVAKVVRDAQMIALDKIYPQYGFARHKGYGTKEHLEALRRFGPTPLHRASFKPVRKILRELREYGVDV